jgi:hypothetical protein
MSADGHFDDPSVRHEFPHPLAALYDLLRNPDDAPRLSAALALAEGLARYLAWTLLADAAARGSTRAELAKYSRAHSFGAWLNAIQHLVGARPATERLYPELDPLLRSPWWTSFQRLLALRNEAAHGRVNLHTSAATLFKQHRSDLVAVLDGCAFLHRHPLGMLGGVRIGADGRPSGTWRSCRGPTPRGSMTELPNASGIPSDQLLLVDVARGLVLSVAPFLCLIEDEFVWLDVPAAGDDRRSPYLSPIPGRALKSSVPSGLYTPGGAHPEGLPLDAWLDAPQYRPRYAALPPGGDVLPRIVGTSRATMAGVPSRGRESAIEPTLADAAVPAGVLRAPSRVPSSLTSVPPGVRGAPTPARSPGRWIIGAGALLGVAAVGVAVSSIGRAPDEVPPADRQPTMPAPRVVPPMPVLLALPVPAQVELAPLSSWAPLEARLREWHSAIRSPRVSAASLYRFYSDSLRFRNSGPIHGDLRFISNFWLALFGRNRGSFEVDWSRSQWRLEPLSEAISNDAAQCAQLPGAAEGVVLARLHAVENDPERSRRAGNQVPCTRLEGVYLVRMRPVPGRGLLICWENWSLRYGVCAPGSCPEAPDCSRP